MSRHPSEPPADWLPSSEEDGMAGYPPPDYPRDRYPPPSAHPSMPDYSHAPGYPAAGYPPPGPDGPSIAHDEYHHSGDPYARLPEEHSPPPEAYGQQQQEYEAPHDPYAQPQEGHGASKGDYGQTSNPPGGYDHPYAHPHDEYSPAQTDHPHPHSDYPPAEDEYGHPHSEYPPAQTGHAHPRDEYPPAEDEHGQADPGYGQAPAHFGSGYGVVPGHHGAPMGGELPALPEPGPDTTAALRRIRPEPPAQPDVEPWPDGPDAADARWTMLGYLTVPLFGPLLPLAVYLRNLRGSNWTRAHAAQALNLWITVMLYNISAVIMGTMLALDSPRAALIVFAPLILALWMIALAVLVRAATAASEGRRYDLPRWLCSPLLH